MASADQLKSAPPSHCPGTQSEEAGKSSACDGCPNQEICATAPKGPDPDIEAIADRLREVKHKVLILSGKGGVGKSTVTKELAHLLAAKGLEVGVLDADICGPSVPRLFGVRDADAHRSNDGWDPVNVADGLSVISASTVMADKDAPLIWRGPQKNGLIKEFLRNVNWGPLDILLIDTPPGTSDEHISCATLLAKGGALSGAIIVTTPQSVAVADVLREVTFCRKASVPILGVVCNMAYFVCPCCGDKTEVFPARRKKKAAVEGEPEIPATLEGLCEFAGAPLLASVPLEGEVGSKGDAGLPFSLDAPAPAKEVKEGTVTAAGAFKQLADALVEKLKLEPSA